jgi:hypothetical protein
VNLLRWRRPGAGFIGALLCIAGLALIPRPPVWAAALGVELMATAFWWWARAAEDPGRHVARWNWLRRPAAALWLAAAIQSASPGYAYGIGFAPGSLEFWRLIVAAAIAWAGLDLVAALPLARPFSDLPGPLIASRRWTPVVLPSAGFIILWRHQPLWAAVEPVRTIAAALLLLTAVLAALRAFGRRSWTASLRWLVVGDGALAGLLVAVNAVPWPVSVMLWACAAGSHAFLLAAELRGARPRRGAALSALWRTTTWITLAALAWPMLLALGPSRGLALDILLYLAAAVPVGLACRVTVGRMVEAEERRTVMRRDPGVPPGHLIPLLLLAGAPTAIISVLWTVLKPDWLSATLAFVPAVIGGAIGLAGILAPPNLEALPHDGPRPGRRADVFARAVFRAVVEFERRLVSAGRRLGLALTAPLRDLHSGDAQEYLLFLIGVSVLAIVLPLLR